MKENRKLRFLCVVLFTLLNVTLSFAADGSVGSDCEYVCTVQYNTHTYTYTYSVSNNIADLYFESGLQSRHISFPDSFKPIHYNVVVQHNGFGDQLWFIASSEGSLEKIDCWRYDLVEEKWFVISSPSFDKSILKVLPFGQSDVAVCTEEGGIYDYNTIVNRWYSLGCLKLKKSLDEITSSDLDRLLKKDKVRFGFVNYTVLIVYLLLLVVMGFYFSKNEKSTEDFFLAGKRIPSWAAGLSIFGTQLSAITFMAMPAKAYSSNWQYFLGNMAIFFIAAPVASSIFIPFFRRLNVVTAYEYLEKRFNFKVRLIASLIYILSQLLRMGIVLFLPALALSTVTGIDIRLTIVIMGTLTTIYTVLGGMEAVIWTDVLQVIVLLAGVFLCMLFIIFDLGGDITYLAKNAFMQGKFSLGQAKLNFSSATIPVILLSLPAVFCPYVADQTVVQRYLTTKDEKDAKKSLWINAWMIIPSTLLFFFVGTMLYMFYFANPEKLNTGMSNDSILPWFIFNELPPGISGLLIAGVFAAAMSSLDSSMNSVSAAIVSDFVTRFNSTIAERRRLILARFIVILLGIISTLTALIMTVYNIKSFWDYFSMLLGPFSGALGGLFLLGACTKRCNAVGGLAGMILGVLIVYIIQFSTSLHFFLYGVISVAMTYAIGYVVSFLTGSNTKDIKNLSLYKSSNGK